MAKTTDTKEEKKVTMPKPARKTVAKNSTTADSKVKKTAPVLSVPSAPEKSVVAVTAKKELATVAVTTKMPASKAKAEPKKAKTNSLKRILFVCSECSPFAGTGGLGEVMGSLPKSISNSNGKYDARVILPLFGCIAQTYRDKMEFMFHINVPVAWRNQYCGVFRLVKDGCTYYFVDNEYYFKRDNIYGYFDDGERFAYFSRAVLEIIKLIDFIPNVLHCQDWHTALVPIYYKLYYKYKDGLENIRTIFTIHNIEYQGVFARSILEDVFGISDMEYPLLEHKGSINLMKGAIDYSDFISTVSPTYAEEILNPFYAHGLEDILWKNKAKLRGILNGIDTEVYNPELNPAIFKHYSVSDLGGKAENKRKLQEMLSLPVKNVPVIALITRLVSHKGLDLVKQAIDEMLKRDVQIVLLGKGEHDYEAYFTHLQSLYEGKLRAIIDFNRDLSHKIYSASDIFLMPSKSEPCGLSQMMACRYGSVPVVRTTGGLKDSIEDCGDGSRGIGFRFDDYNAGSMLYALDRAIGMYYDSPDIWRNIVVRCMTTDFSWANSAIEYEKFYNEIL